ncbi:MAG: N-acetylmuramoyl-L-alanine amidase, partial [Candidatus Altimarinota bacterium]
GANEDLRLSTAQAEGVEADLIKFEDDYYEKFANELKAVKTVSTDANGNLYSWPQTYPEKISKIIVHHTATANNLDDPKRAIRDIYYWHTISKGWGDIGYNYIIDQQGNIYEGRAGGEGVVGAHAGRGNHGSIGIAVLGNYQDNEPPEAVINSLTALIKDKATLYNIDTEGSSVFRGVNYPNVMGHRDVMTTACPGEKLFAMLPVIKKMAKADFSKSTGVKVSADYDFAYNQTPSLVKYAPKGRKEISLSIKNTGKKAWPAGTYFQINNNASSRMFLRNAQEILSGTVGKEIKPGESTTVKLLTFANSTSGSAVVEIYPVINGKKVERYLPLAIQVTTPAPKLKYDYELVSIIYDKETFKKGDTVNARISIRNKGTATWVNSGGNKVTLGADKPRDHMNTLMAKPSQRLSDMQQTIVKSGELATFTVKLKVPSKDGIYREYFAPVVEGVQWMENKNSFIEMKIGNVKEDASPEPAEFENSGVAEKPVNSTTSTASTASNTSGGSNVNIAANKLDLNKAAGNIRIDLGYRGNPATISANGQFSLYDGARQIKSFQADQQVKVELVNGSFKVTYGSDNWSISRPTFKPASGVIMRIDNWERRNTWGDKANNNEFRGNLEVLIYDKELHVINELPLEDYLKGIAEESGTAPQDKIKTIMVLARTYARFYMEVAEKFPGAPFHLNDDPNTSQKYMGYAFEKRSAGTVAMVEATKGKVVTYEGKLIKTPYFSRSDGKATISASSKWGWTDTPFLQSVDDSHCASTEFWGHGVGLSGCGATELAKRGKTFEEIIKYYYKGVEVSQAK